jgi:hypothetical protein
MFFVASFLCSPPPLCRRRTARRVGRRLHHRPYGRPHGAMRAPAVSVSGSLRFKPPVGRAYGLTGGIGPPWSRDPGGPIALVGQGERRALEAQGGRKMPPFLLQFFGGSLAGGGAFVHVRLARRKSAPAAGCARRGAWGGGATDLIADRHKRWNALVQSSVDSLIRYGSA